MPLVNSSNSLYCRLTTESGNQYLVHKGSGYGKSSQTVVVDAKHMSSNWKVRANGITPSCTVCDVYLLIILFCIALKFMVSLVTIQCSTIVIDDLSHPSY